MRDNGVDDLCRCCAQLCSVSIVHGSLAQAAADQIELRCEFASVYCALARSLQ
jgi:hypothetical protein